MGNPYTIVHLHRDWLDRPEEMGSKRKVWCRIDGLRSVPGGQWLFKFPQANTGQHWAEKIASEVAARLETPHAAVRLACIESEKGSMCQSFLDYGQGLIHGNELLGEGIAGYDPDKKYGQSDHTLDNIWHVLESWDRFAGEQLKAKDQFAEYLVLDALVGNTDRHHENWGIVLTVDGATWSIALAPSFDHASSLGRELLDARRDRLISQGQVGSYVERGKGGICWSGTDRRAPSPLDLIRRGARRHPAVFRPALAKVHQLGEGWLREAVERVPESWMTPSAREFAIQVMSYTSRCLREVQL